MNIAVLKAEIDGDPFGRGYSEMTNVEVATSLNTVEDQIVGDTEKKTFRDLIASVDMTTAITIITVLKIAAAENVVVESAVNACSSYGANGGIDFSHTNTIAAIDALVAGAILSTDQATILKNLGKKTVTRSHVLNLGLVKVGHIQEARK